MKTTGHIINGRYYRAGEELNNFIDDRSSTYKEWDRDEQRRKHRHDLIQPYKNGKPNEDFVTHYPDEARGYGFL